VKAEDPERFAPFHLLLDAKLQDQGDTEKLPASAFLFEMLTNILRWVENNNV
jgi:hypothetical protein